MKILVDKLPESCWDDCPFMRMDLEEDGYYCLVVNDYINNPIKCRHYDCPLKELNNK